MGRQVKAGNRYIVQQHYTHKTLKPACWPTPGVGIDGGTNLLPLTGGPFKGLGLDEERIHGEGDHPGLECGLTADAQTDIPKQVGAWRGWLPRQEDHNGNNGAPLAGSLGLGFWRR